MRISEASIENAIIEHLNHSGFFAFKNYDQAQKVGESYRKHKWQCRGQADISVLTKIGVVYIEVKTPDGKQSEYQKKFEDKCKIFGVNYFICRSIKDGRKVVEKIKELERKLGCDK